MPQASEKLRAEWRHSEEGGGDRAAIKFLEDAGYALDRSWCWVRPSSTHEPTDKEMSAVCYLIDEWDFGGIAA